MKKFCIYGNPTIDIIKLSRREEYLAYGGGSYYSSIPLLSRGESVEVYAVYTPRLVGHPISKLIVKAQHSSRTNTFLLNYTSSGEREVRVLEVSESLYPWNSHEGLCYTIVNPVLREVSLDMLKYLKHKSLMVAVDIQGFVRFVENGIVKTRPDPQGISVLSEADVVHLDLEEALSLSGSSNVDYSLMLISKHVRGVAVVTVRPSTVFVITREGSRRVVFENTPIVADRTGSGDHYLASYFYNYICSNDELEASYKAHAETTEWLIKRSSLVKTQANPAVFQ